MAEKKREQYRLPVLKTEAVLFPGMVLQFDIKGEAETSAVAASMTADCEILLIREGGKCGSRCMIMQALKTGGDTMRIQIKALTRAVPVSEFSVSGSTEYVTVEIPETGVIRPKARRIAMVREMSDKYLLSCKERGIMGLIAMEQFKDDDDPGVVADRIMSSLPIEDDKKQKVLECGDVRDRVDAVLKLLQEEAGIANERHLLSEKISQQIDDHQREYVLREQLALIQSELEEDDEPSETEQYKKAAESLKAPDEVKEKLKKEIRHLELNGFANPESATIRAYIETLLELPWDKETEGADSVIDINKAREILNRDHYGLKEVKERVLEYLAVRSLTSKGESPILCLVGPPGTGKTSIARSVAEATGKPYVRISLGGVRDEAEIRGHRKTYVGAMPGRITAGIKQAGVKDPLMLLDEIDKMIADYHGETSSAMLEVLDSEQNKNFRDHYVELPMDLSKVLFIATANDDSMIPRPLLDRMEIIEISGYTANEKFHIATEHLMKKVYEKNGLSSSQLKVSDGAVRRIIECYCREAGVRALERELDRLCRKAAVKMLEGSGKRGRKKKGVTLPLRVSERNLEEYLGKIKFPKEKLGGKDEAGIVRGLAWTSVGGDTLRIEVNIMPGKGELMLTGQLGDVMKESAMAGLSYVRSVAKRYGVEKNYFQENDIHIHIPEGAVPKDGPSAGITMATAMLSAITGRKVRRDLAMTGEISLRGMVMPVGGLKEKILAARMLGIKTVLVPDENRRDVEEIDKEITGGVEIKYMKQMDQVIREAFVGENED